MKKKTRHEKRKDRGKKDAHRSSKERAGSEIKTFLSLPEATAIDATDASCLPLAQVASDAVSNVEDATTTKSALHVHIASALDLSRREGTGENELITLPNPAGEAANGESLAIDGLPSLAPEECEIVRQSDLAFVRVRQTWESWKLVRAGLVVLRNLAMREAGANDPKSKRYKDRFHKLLEYRAYSSARMDPSTRKALLKSAELAPQIDEWHDQLDEHRRLRLNHPVSVLCAFREFQKPRGTPTQANGNKHERELETVRQEAATAVSSRDERIGVLQKEIDKLSKRVDIPQPGESDVETIAPRVIAMCGGDGSKIRQVIDALNAHLERNPS